jgi:hypothetical protein
MNDPENFLSRWARRKRDAERASDAPARETAEQQEGPEPGAKEPQEAPEAAAPKPAEGGAPAFDLSKLPSIDSITAETDIRAFLAPGVPAELTRAALRRVWVADPKIRDFVEIAENQWDFTAAGVPGFDLSAPTGNVARMVAQVFGARGPHESAERPAGAPADPPAPQGEADGGSHRLVNESPPGEPAEAAAPAPDSPQQLAAMEQEDIASQKEGEDARPSRDARRRGHGGALPR